jgi:hypothetical protein
MSIGFFLVMKVSILVFRDEFVIVKSFPFVEVAEDFFLPAVHFQKFFAYTVRHQADQFVHVVPFFRMPAFTYSHLSLLDVPGLEAAIVAPGFYHIPNYFVQHFNISTVQHREEQ